MGLAESAGLVNCKIKHSSREFKVLGKKNSLKQGVLKDFRHLFAYGLIITECLRHQFVKSCNTVLVGGVR